MYTTLQFTFIYFVQWLIFVAAAVCVFFFKNSLPTNEIHSNLHVIEAFHFSENHSISTTAA